MSHPASGPSPARPRQVTLAGVMATVACVLLVLGLFDTMSGIGSTETQDSVEDFLSSAPGDRLGLDVDGVVDVLRGLVLLSGALSAAGAILAVYCMRRHRGARIGLSVVAVAMLFSTTFVAGLLPFVVALSASMLWRQEARDWFDGRPARPRAEPGSSASPASPPSWSDPPQAGAGPSRAPSSTQPDWPPPAFEQRTSPGHAGTPPPQIRPAAVTAAVWLTWVSSALVLLLMATLVVYLLTDRSVLLAPLQRNPRIASLGYTSDELTGALWVLTVLVTFWAVAAAAFAVLAYCRLRTGQVGVVACAVLAGIVGITTVVAPVLAVVTVVLLVRRDANRWFDRRSGAAGGPGQQPPGPPQAPQERRPPDQPTGKPPVW